MREADIADIDILKTLVNLRALLVPFLMPTTVSFPGLVIAGYGALPVAEPPSIVIPATDCKDAISGARDWALGPIARM